MENASRPLVLLTSLRLGAAVVLAGATLAFAAAASAREQRAHAADTIVVAAGQSIQQAIDRADPGDTIVVAAGVYRENLTIVAKDDITLRGAGDTDSSETSAGPRFRTVSADDRSGV